MSDTQNDIIPCDWHLWSQSRPTFIRALAGGQTNRTYLVSSGEELLVVRHNSPLSQALDLNRAAEAQVLSRASHAGLCAPLIYCDPHCQYLVTEFIQGQPWHKETAGALEQLAKLLRNIHSLPAIGSQLDIELKIDHYWSSIDTQADFYPLLQQLHSELSTSFNATKAIHDNPCLCHNDLTKENLIKSSSGQLIAIDWEYASMGDRFYDLAALVEEHYLSAAQQQQLLAIYLQRTPDSNDWQRLHHWRLIYKYLCVLWYALQWSAKKELCDSSAIITQCQALLTLAASTPDR
ncbi:phosphotransferase [Microbulbifer sp. CnH-101-G]|uniref:phosphotransferase n=1 Tax=Microbulbifer sp. CnH-101-G TaxID=3243393 RepID=UPI004039E863